MIRYPKTQKAKGIINALPELFDNKNSELKMIIFRLASYPRHQLIANKKEIDSIYEYPHFARPCPKRPRHGFVDSVVVKNREDLIKLWDKTIDADPNAEILLGPYFPKVAYNSIFVSSGIVAVGAGNDGATAGKNSLRIPVSPHCFKNSFAKSAGINTKKDAVFLEAIRPWSYSPQNFWHVVQARGGPAISSESPDFIPKSIVVKKIVHPHKDLLKWEKDVAKFEPGTVVYGKGFTLASHAAIHCVINNVPFITSYEPKVGEKIKASSRKNNRLNRSEFNRGVRAGLSDLLKDGSLHFNMARFFYYSASVLHNWAYIRNSEHASWILGSAAAIFTKIGSALCLGEHRHIVPGSVNGRDLIYEKAMSDGMTSILKMPKVTKDFYDEDWETGYGGTAWANCAWYTNELWNKVAGSFNKKTEKLSLSEANDIITIMNKVINISHNSGWWLDKIVSREDLDFVAENPGLAAFIVSEVFFIIHKKVSSVKAYAKNARIKKINNSHYCHKDKNGNAIWATVHDNYYYGKHLAVVVTVGEENYIERKKITETEYTKFCNSTGGTLRPFALNVTSRMKVRIPGTKHDIDLRKVYKGKYDI